MRRSSARSASRSARRCTGGCDHDSAGVSMPRLLASSMNRARRLSAAPLIASAMSSRAISARSYADLLDRLPGFVSLRRPANRPGQLAPRPGLCALAQRQVAREHRIARLCHASDARPRPAGPPATAHRSGARQHPCREGSRRRRRGPNRPVRDLYFPDRLLSWLGGLKNDLRPASSAGLKQWVSLGA